jgi:drug/metabolite transporter (DMT)-like permease
MSVMRRGIVIAAAILIVVVIFAAIVPMWEMTAAVDLPPFAIFIIVMTVVGCFAMGGGLMFLMFYSSRKGFDDDVHNGVGWRESDID